jgi:RNA polymerase sigma-70 factor, ECF subfamily
MCTDQTPRPIETIETLYRSYATTLLAHARRLTGTEADAQDLLQDTFERAARAYASFRAGSNAKAWLFTIMSRLFIDGCRRRRRSPVKLGPPLSLEAPAPEPEEEPAWLSVTSTQLEAALTTLPAAARALVEQQALGGASYQVLAAEYGIDCSTVGTRLFRDRNKLRRVLVESCANDVDSHATRAIAA